MHDVSVRHFPQRDGCLRPAPAVSLQPVALRHAPHPRPRLPPGAFSPASVQVSWHGPPPPAWMQGGLGSQVGKSCHLSQGSLTHHMANCHAPSGHGEKREIVCKEAAQGLGHAARAPVWIPTLIHQQLLQLQGVFPPPRHLGRVKGASSCIAGAL